jgi:SAM-dependent methyltransferase
VDTNSKSFLVLATGLFFGVVVLSAVFQYFFLNNPKERSGPIIFHEKNQVNLSTDSSPFLLVVPFVLIRNTVGRVIEKGKDSVIPNTTNYHRSIENAIQSALAGYNREATNALCGLSSMLESALLLEEEEENISGTKTNKISTSVTHSARLSTKVKHRIQRMSACLEHNEQVLTTLLGNFSFVMALPDKEIVFSNEKMYSGNSKDTQRNISRLASSSLSSMPYNALEQFPSRFHLMDSRGKRGRSTSVQELETHSYDSAFQIIAHLVRDWTVEGRLVRESIYNWCYQQVDKFAVKRRGLSILVPGAGMGRLAYDLYQRGHHVEANELSPSMAAAACSILQQKVTGRLHPYVLDVMANEVESNRRYDVVSFPDVSIKGKPGGSFSYTIGDFAGNGDYYYYSQKSGQFDLLITCFFIDTANNIYEYLQTINEVLKPKTGIWINVGPLQWHQNAMLRPSADELKDLLQAYGFSLKVWKIDRDPISYRESEKYFVRMTNFDGYRPLRFVAIKTKS